MKLLILATNSTAPETEEKIRAGQHHRVDYIDLARQFSTRYLDYNIIPNQRLARNLEERLRIDYRLAKQAAKTVKMERYDTVFSMSERVGIPLGFMLEPHVKHIVQVAHPLSPWKLRLIQLLNAHRRWDMMIVPTRAEERALRKQLGLGPDRIRMLHYPVDAKYYHPLKNLPPSDEPEHAESLGLSYRDYPSLVRAMRQLPHVTMYIRAGSAWVQHAAGYEKKPLPSNIYIQPYVSPDALRYCYMRSRFSVIPIRKTTQWSAGCTTITQSQAMGRAVITTCNPGVVDYMLENETGLIARTGDPVTLAEAIDTLWRDPEKSEAMGQRGRQWIEEYLTVDQWMIEITKILEM